MRNVAFTVSSVSSASPPSITPAPTATGRFRPVAMCLDGVSGVACPAGSAAGAGSPLALPSGLGSSGVMSVVLTRRSVYAGLSDLEQLGFLVLEQLVDLRDVGVGQLLQLPLGTAHLVLARLAVLDHLVQRVLGVPPDVADADAAVLRLGPGGLDVLPPTL